MPNGKKLSNKRLRDTQRLVHLAGALVLIAFVYVPGADTSLFTALMRFVVVPGLILTGLAMWQLPRLRARMRKTRV